LADSIVIHPHQTTHIRPELTNLLRPVSVFSVSRFHFSLLNEARRFTTLDAIISLPNARRIPYDTYWLDALAFFLSQLFR